MRSTKIGALTGAGITILSTVEVEDDFHSLQFSHYAISFLTDDIIRLRYVEIDGQLRKVMMVIKKRGGNHSKDIREYVITDQGVMVIHPIRTGYEGLHTHPDRPAEDAKGRTRAGAKGAIIGLTSEWPHRGGARGGSASRHLKICVGPLGGPLFVRLLLAETDLPFLTEVKQALEQVCDRLTTRYGCLGSSRG